MNEFKVRKGLIVQGSGSTLLDIQGSQGQLFSVTDSLSGSLFSVNDISGMPIMEVFSDDRVLLGTFNAEAIKVSGSTASITGSLFGTSSWAVSASVAVTASFASTASFLNGGTTNAFVQNGNSFGTTALLGTNDNNSLALETSGSTRMFISSSGNVGIGTTSSLSRFHITSPTDTGYPTLGSQKGSFFLAGDTNLYGLMAGIDASSGTFWMQAMRNNTATAYNILLNPVGGNVGIGTTSPNAKLDISGSLNISGSGVQIPLQVSSGSTPLLFVSQSGNVGINTSAPDTKLHIEDVTKVLTGNVAGVAQGTLSLVSTDAQAADIGASLVFGGNYINSNNTRIAYAGITGRKSNSSSVNADGYLSFLTWRSTGLTEAMRITAAGSVGINTTSPTLGTLQVNGNVYATSYTGSLFGTSSWAVNSVTSSYPLKVSGNSIFSTHTDSAAGGTNASTTHSIFIGRGAGDGATTANNSTFIGYSAGQSATNANNSNFIGNTVGVTATNAYNSNFFGASAGYAAGNANDSNFFGASAGGYATSASFSNFIGNTAGNKAASASYSNLIGFHAGYNPSFAAGTGIKSNNIIIGTNITLPDGTRDSVNIGGIIFATGSYATTAGNPYSGSVNTGRVGIGKVTPSVTLDISGSTTVTGSLNVSQGITGSLFGTASWAVSASWAPGGGSTTPGGSNTQIQYNNGGAFGGVPNLTWDGTTLRATGSLAGNASTATLLANARTLWGRTFDGTANVTGDLTSVGTITGTSGTDLVISTGGGDRVNITTTTAQAIRFNTNNTLRWIIDGTSGNLTSTGAQTITTTTGNLTLATNAGNGNILLTPNGTGRVGVNTTTPTSASLTVSGNVWATSYTGSLFGTASWAVSASWAPGGGGSSITVQDEGSTLTTALTSLNFVGSGVAATNSGGAVTVTIAGAGGSAFPYTGSAEITGSLRVTGSITSTTDATINSVTVGRGAGNITTNIVIGSGSLINNTTGGSNTAIGHTALQSNSTGSDNTAVGAGAGQQVTGNGNTLIGSRTGEAIVSGHNNTLIGGNLRYGPDGTSFAGSYTLGIGKMSVNESRVPHIWAPEDGSVTTGGTGTLLRLDPTKYSGFFIEYVIDDTGGKMRSGTLKGIFKSDMSAIQWAEVDALTIGNTSAAIFTVTGSGTGYLDVLLANNIGSTIYHSFTSRLILRN